MTQREFLYKFYYCNSEEILKARCHTCLSIFSLDSEMTDDIIDAFLDIVEISDILEAWELESKYKGDR